MTTRTQQLRSVQTCGGQHGDAHYRLHAIRGKAKYGGIAALQKALTVPKGRNALGELAYT